MFHYLMDSPDEDSSPPEYPAFEKLRYNEWQYQKHWQAHCNILSSEAFKVNSSWEIWGSMQYCVWALGFSETWHCINGWVLPSILKKCSTFIFMCHGAFFMALLTLEDERNYVSSRCQKTPTHWHCIIYQRDMNVHSQLFLCSSFILSLWTF